MTELLLWITPGPFELLVVAIVILLLFGNRLPGVMRSLGQGFVEFKKGARGQDDDQGKGTDEQREHPGDESKP